MALGRSAQTAGSAPHRTPRNHQERRSRGAQAFRADQYGPRRRATGAPHPRPAGRLQDLAHVVAQDPRRVVGRTRAVGRGQIDRRSRTRDRSFRRTRILDGLGAPMAARPPRLRAHARRGPRQRRWQEAREVRHSDGSRCHAFGKPPAKGEVRGHQRQDAGSTPFAGRAVHHQHAAAGSVAPPQDARAPHDASRPRAVRRRRCRRRGHDRSHHLHAHRFDQAVDVRHGSGARVHQSHVRRGIPQRQTVQGFGRRARRARSHPADRCESHAR